MDELIYSKNWNGKLSSLYHRTIRPHNKRKFYVGNLLKAVCRDNTVQPFTVRIEELETRMFDSFTDAEISVDTGMPADEARQMFKRLYKEIDFAEQEFAYPLLKRLSDEEIIREEGDLFAKLDRIRHPAPKKKDQVLKQVREIGQKQNVCFLDTETTGFEGEAIEIAVLRLDGEVMFNELIKPVKNEIDPGALSVHGIYLNDVADKKYLYEYRKFFESLFQDYIIIMYNSEFDTKILKESMYRQLHLDEEMGKASNKLQSADIHCLMKWFAVYKGIESDKPHSVEGFKAWKLQEACKEMSAYIPNIKAHRALADCQLTRSLFLKLLEEK